MKVSRLCSSVFALGVVALTSVSAFADDVYVALGDSFAWGYDKGFGGGQSAGPGGGYYTSFAAYLEQHNGPTGLQSFNFAVPGETTETYFSGVPAPKIGGSYPTPSPTGLIDAPFRDQSYNTNYPTFNPLSPTAQAAQLESLAASLVGSGNTIKYITLQIGGNDILGTAAQLALNPELAALPDLQKAAIINQRFNDMSNNLVSVLSTISATAPEAQVYILTYPDAFPGLGPFNPLPQSGILNSTATSIFTTLANAFGAKLVDVRADFVGNELALTNIGTLDGALPNFHPNSAGYAVISNRLILATAPEPGTFALIACAALPLVGLVRRRK